MEIFDRLNQLLVRLQGYSKVELAVELIVIWLIVYAVVRFVQGTRAAGALKGVLFVLLVATLGSRILGSPETFQRLTFLYETFLTIVAIALIVIFQPELRRGFIRLGETRFFRTNTDGAADVIDSVVEAAAFLSRARFGELIVLERDVGLRGLVEGGTTINADVSARLLQTLFFPGTALHDLAVIISEDRITAAGVQLPLADPEEMSDPTLGSRHRAAVGLTKECDAIVVVVSEESGAISLAERGRLLRELTTEQVTAELRLRMSSDDIPATPAAAETPGPVESAERESEGSTGSAA